MDPLTRQLLAAAVPLLALGGVATTRRFWDPKMAAAIHATGCVFIAIAVVLLLVAFGRAAL